jgi:hypothetical protein
MHGLGQGMLEAGRNVGQMGGRFFEAGGNHGTVEILCLVLGILLWAAVMTTLVMCMIALVRHLKGPKTVQVVEAPKAKASDK